MHLHLDAVGGLAGDMFAAALLDTFPQHEAAVVAAVRAATARQKVDVELVAHNDGVLSGHRFVVHGPQVAESAAHGHEHPGHRAHHHAGHGCNSHSHGDSAAAQGNHAHRHWAEIRAELLDAGLLPAVRDGAVAIFTHLAHAEARVHGIGVEEVAFHEVGAWDSIADIVAAASLIDAIGAESWSVGSLPLGGGRVKTAHGLLPVPAPATAILLEGFAMVDDGVSGERVTPTGAAILRHLFDGKPHALPHRPRTLGRSGTGFGTRTLPGMSNCLRVLAFDEQKAATADGHRALAVIEFEVDDQSAEDLALGIERLRKHQDIFDIVQMPVFGKKGRIMTHVRALAREGAQTEVIAACFRETTTIGLRHHVVAGAALPRRLVTVEVAGQSVRVKTVERPGGRTAKAEADDAAGMSHAERAGLRRAAERLALADDNAP